MGRSGGASGRRGGGGGRGVSPDGSERESRGAAGRGASGSRSQRVASLVRQAVAEILSLGVKDPRVAGVVITDIDLTGDLREARLYYFLAGDEAVRAAAAEGLARCAGYVRRELGQRVSLRVVPSVEFRLDTSSDYGARIDARLRELGLGAGAKPKVGDDMDAFDDEDDGGDVAADEDDGFDGDDFDQDEATEPGLKARPAPAPARREEATESPDESLGSLDDPTPAASLGEPYDEDDDDHTEPGRALSGELPPLGLRGADTLAELPSAEPGEPEASEPEASEPEASEPGDERSANGADESDDDAGAGRP